jgi:hypothetical protein
MDLSSIGVTAVKSFDVSQALTMTPNAMVPDEKPSTTLPGVVEKVIKPHDPRDPEKAQIVVEGADHLYREIRIDNTLSDANGEEVALKPGAAVEVTVAADPADTVKK